MSNFYYDWVMEKNNFFCEGIIAFNGQQYEIQPYHVLWPIPQSLIDAKAQGIINQNYGYAGYGNNVPPFEAILAEEQ